MITIVLLSIFIFNGIFKMVAVLDSKKEGKIIKLVR